MTRIKTNPSGGEKRNKAEADASLNPNGNYQATSTTRMVRMVKDKRTPGLKKSSGTEERSWP